MRILTLLVALVATVVLAVPAAAAPTETAEVYAKRVLPTKSELAWKVAPVTAFGPAGASLALYHDAEGPVPLRGFLLWPKGGQWTKAPLPEQPYKSWGLYEVKDVFTAAVGKERLLFVRAEHMTGIGPTGAQPFSVTWVYRWDGKAVRARQDLVDRIGQAEARPAILKKAAAK